MCETSAPWTRTARVDATGTVRDLAAPTLPCSRSYCGDIIEDKVLSVQIKENLPTDMPNTPQEINDQCSVSSETISTGADSSSSSLESLPLATSPGYPTAQENEAILDIMDNLDDVDESYMLSVYWNSGDSVHHRSGNSSVAGITMCSHASSNSSATSMSNYTWTSSSRYRHKGAYHKRSREWKEAKCVASWVDTMHESTVALLGPLNKWSVSKGWQNKDGQKWDPTADIDTWGSLDPIFDRDHHLVKEA